MTATTAQAWRITAGDLSGLRLDTARSVPAPVLNQVTVDVKACGLNFADVFACLGLYSATPEGEFTPGLEFAGVISAIGPEVKTKTLCVGDRVMGVTRFGGYATRLNIEEWYVRPIPAAWTFEEGAAFPAQALTAYYGLTRLGGLKANDVVLVHSAAGGTGLWATHICRALGAHVVGTVGGPSKVEELKRLTGLPASAIVPRSEYESSRKQQQAVLSLAANTYVESGKFDIVFDSLMGDWFTPSHLCVGPMGRHVVLGAGAMTPSATGGGLGVADWLQLGYQYMKRARVDPLNMISENKSVMAFNLIWLYERTDLVGVIFDELLALAAKLPPPHVGETFPFEDAPKALRRFQSGATIGKVVLTTTTTTTKAAA